MQNARQITRTKSKILVIICSVHVSTSDFPILASVWSVFKGIVQREKRGVESGINRTVLSGTQSCIFLGLFELQKVFFKIRLKFPLSKPKA
jgi:hypothetical protein